MQEKVCVAVYSVGDVTKWKSFPSSGRMDAYLSLLSTMAYGSGRTFQIIEKSYNVDPSEREHADDLVRELRKHKTN